jgi:hypothetical protein
VLSSKVILNAPMSDSAAFTEAYDLVRDAIAHAFERDTKGMFGNVAQYAGVPVYFGIGSRTAMAKIDVQIG